ncbi:MAG: dual specificity protein phosphatase family protein [Deltaproteobacteria bacterium]|nr:dual specificity protein phosphatase family protein [Deltaproteobacteria bacterium]
MGLRERLTERLLARLGLEWDFTLSLQRALLSEITETLYLGSRPRREDAPTLKKAGITHVVSCLPEDERSTVAFLAEHFRWLFVPARDGIHEDLSATFPGIFEFAAKAADDEARAKLLVHCEVGVSRSATVAIAWVMQSENKTFLEAFDQVRSARPEVLPNIGFASQLQRLEHSLRPELRATREPSSLARYLTQVCNVPTELELLHEALERHDYDAPRAIRSIFGDEIPRVVQGVRL